MDLTTIWKRLFAKPYATIGPKKAAALLDADAVLLDVRESQEWDAGHAPQARHIPLGQLPGRLSEVPAGRTIVTVCRSGTRSRQAAALLAREGLQAVTLAGGMRAWAEAGLLVVAAGGRVGQVV